MGKSFKSVKDTGLDEFDVLPFGKLKGCRIHDLINEDYEYLIWLEKNTSIRYNKGLIEKIKAKCLANGWERYKREEVDPYKDDYNTTEYDDELMLELGILHDDIPF